MDPTTSSPSARVVRKSADGHRDDQIDGASQKQDDEDPSVTLHHRFAHNRSILTLAFSRHHVFAGTQGGKLLVFALKTCQQVAAIQAHNGSVLNLCLSDDGKLLFSSAGDRIVNVCVLIRGHDRGLIGLGMGRSEA